MSIIFTKLLHQDAKIPTKATSEAAGFDLYAFEDCEILPQNIQKIPTGICMEIPKKHFGKIFDRSSLALQQIICMGGIIDSDYRGDIFVILLNLSTKSYCVKKFDKVAQLVCIPYIECEIRKTCELSDSIRGLKGFGSSGK
jgi:deoxyuridine 5'-triphosphate nucleotidohydrolase